MWCATGRPWVVGLALALALCARGADPRPVPLRNPGFEEPALAAGASVASRPPPGWQDNRVPDAGWDTGAFRDVRLTAETHGGGTYVTPARPSRVPVLDVTDLYHPHQDVGDNVDLVNAFALPEIDLRGVVLDMTEKYVGEGLQPGRVPVQQLNAIFGRSVPCGVGPYRRLRDPQDRADDVPAEQQTGVQLILDVLRASPERVHVVSFGSARPLAAAANRDPELCRRKLAKIHLCAGGGSPGAVEWNVALDPQAIVCLLRSGLPVAVYPCARFSPEAGGHAVFQAGPDNTYWHLPDHAFFARLDPALRRYLAFAVGRNPRADAVAAVESDAGWDAFPAQFATRQPPFWQHVWETAVWMSVAQRRFVARGDGPFQCLPADQVRPGDRVVAEGLVPCMVRVLDNGWFDLLPASGPTTTEMYVRPDPAQYEAAARQAVPALFESFRTR